MSHPAYRRLLLLVILGTTRICNAVDYLQDVKPLLKHKCYACHGALQQQGGLRLDTAAALIAGGDSDATISPGKPDGSFLLDVTTGEIGFQMPPANEGAPFTDEEVHVILEWIAAGASVPADELPEADPPSWWSYRPIERPALPEVPKADWCGNEVAHFVAAQRVRNDLTHVGQASK